MAKKVKNEYFKIDDYYELHIYNKKDEIKAKVLFDEKYINLIKNYGWCAYNNRKTMYIHSHIGNCKYIRLHTLILENEIGISNLTIDHINGNGLDNRLINLRYATESEQNLNKSVFKNNKFGITGISRVAKNGKYRAEIKYMNKSYVKVFKKLEDAINQRKEWEVLFNITKDNLN